MWKHFFEYFRALVTLAEATRQNKEEIKEIRRELHQLAVKVQLLEGDQRHQIESLALRLENQLLRFERRLPPPRRDQQ